MDGHLPTDDRLKVAPEVSAAFPWLRWKGRFVIIAVDGPSASGKGTVSRRLAQKLGFACLDTGLLYRAVGMAVVRMGGDPNDGDAALAAALSLNPSDASTLSDPALRTDQASDAASKVAIFPLVREALLDFQRRFARLPPDGALGAILDGRDIGTVVCPEADAKIFITASVEIRAERRVKELQKRGLTAIYADVLADMQRRDARDSLRVVAPTKAADDAFVLDTSALTAEEVFQQALAFVYSKTGLDASQGSGS